jgi:thiol:disulfide interchange protein DsbD
MGTALGYALTADAPAALGVFALLGAGFAAPFVALSFTPALLRLLPRPGAWMVTFRQLLAFPMYGAAVWLIWVLSLQAGPQGVLAALAAAVMLAFALWVAGRQVPGRRSRLATGAATIAIAGAVLLVAQTSVSADAGRSAGPASADSLSYEPFSPERLAALQQAGRPVFVNATAAWCITCLVNEKLALSGPSVARAFSQHNVAALKADWTNQNAAITALLARHGRSGVPLYLYFPPGATAPTVLPQLLTEGTVVAAIQKAS